MVSLKIIPAICTPHFGVYFAESLFQTHSKTEDFDINLQKVITCL